MADSSRNQSKLWEAMRGLVRQIDHDIPNQYSFGITKVVFERLHILNLDGNYINSLQLHFTEHRDHTNRVLHELEALQKTEIPSLEPWEEPFADIIGAGG